MKNFLKLIALITLTAILCLTFSSCTLLKKIPTQQSVNTDIPITYGKKYICESKGEIYKVGS